MESALRRRPYWKSVMRYAPDERIFRIGRLIYQGGPKGSCPGQPGGGYSAKLSVSLMPKLFGFSRGWHEWTLTLFGVRIHHLKAFGGWVCALLLMLSLPALASAEVLIVSTASDKPGILPATPGERAALDRWREGFEARPASCAKCGLVCDCGDCRCEAVKVKPTYTAAPANVECRNGRCYRVSPVQPVRQQASVRYVPQAAPVCRPGMPCYQQQSQPARGRLLPRFFR